MGSEAAMIVTDTEGMKARALEARDAERVREEAARAAERERREAKNREADQAFLDWAGSSPVCTEWFPEITWELVDRVFPQRTAVIVPAGHARDPRVPHFIVTQHGETWSIQIASRFQVPTAQPYWLMGAQPVRSLADVGRWYERQEER